jgi:hypothetical protein
MARLRTHDANGRFRAAWIPTRRFGASATRTAWSLEHPYDRTRRCLQEDAIRRLRRGRIGRSRAHDLIARLTRIVR